MAKKKVTKKKATKKATKKKAKATKKKAKATKKKATTTKKKVTRKKATKKTTKKKTTKKKATKKATTRKKATKKKAKKKTKRKPNAAFMKPMTPSAALAAVVGSKPLPRTQVIKKLWAYIRKRKLQNPKNKRNILADAKLKSVFGGKKEITMFEMMKHVNKNLK